jgi:hypothetical protein
MVRAGCFSVSRPVKPLRRDAARILTGPMSPPPDRGTLCTASRMTLLQEAGLLVIDDLGTAHRGKGERVWADETILELLMPRYQHGRFTIITSNLRLDDIDEPRIRSRIKGLTNVDQTGRQQCLLIENSDQREGSRK